GIMSITLMGQPFVIVNDPAIAAEILDKRGMLYADRPILEMVNMSGWDRVLSSARYGPQFKEYRKLIGRVIGTRGSMVKFYPVQDYQANMLLKRVLENPSAFDEVSTGAMVLHLTYGYKIKERANDPLVDLADKALGEFSEITRPGAFLVDVLPICPFPGARFKRLAKTYTKSCDDLAEVPLAYVKEQMATGQQTESYASNLLLDRDISEDRLYEIKWSTVSVVTAYFLAAAKYPEMQIKAQAEIDAVVDRDSLPYIEAICKELYRWLPIVPLAVPHRAMTDDVYKGYFIPEGALVIANADPFDFNPDRFLGPNPAPHPTDVGVYFLITRHYLQHYNSHMVSLIGTHLADVSVWINVAKAVAGLTVTPRQIELVADTTDGIITRPVPFKCTVTARSAQIMPLVLDATSDVP
ncbi:cytochrome P450, partial [Mycena olivaceomarginata]